MAWVGALIAIAAAAASEYNSEQTAKRQDNQAAAGLIEQGRKQKQADSKVNDEVQKLAGSNATDERAAALQNYMTTLQRGKQTAQAGLNTPNIGGSAFQASSAQAANDVQFNAANTAGLMSRIDAPGMQRQGEGFDYGNLATDLSLISREAQGDDYLNQLRIKAIRRNPWIDVAAAGASGYAGAYSGKGSSASLPSSSSAASAGGGSTYGQSNLYVGGRSS
jgi:hypothetical protein